MEAHLAQDTRRSSFPVAPSWRRTLTHPLTPAVVLLVTYGVLVQHAATDTGSFCYDPPAYVDGPGLAATFVAALASALALGARQRRSWIHRGGYVAAILLVGGPLTVLNAFIAGLNCLTW